MAEATDLALLAPVPLMHLQSGQKICESEGKVAFGSRDYRLFEKLDGMLEGERAVALIYASEAREQDLPRVTWKARYIGHLRSRGGAHPDGTRFRPPTTSDYPEDNAGYWAVFWEVVELAPIDRLEERVLIRTLRGLGSRRALGAAFVPHGPILVEYP